MTIRAIASSEDAAAANRSGRMTEQQQRFVALAVRSETSQGLISVGILVGLVLLILLVALGSANSSAADASGYAFFDVLFLIGLLIMGVLFWRRARLLAEVKAGELERATGHVEWKGGRYRAAVPGRTLDLTAFNLGAGTYDFSYLPRSGRVVAAELAAADTPDQAKAELGHALAVTNHFNVDDLPAFRQGRLGRSAFRRLRRTWSIAGWFLLVAVVLLVIFVYMVSAGVSQDLAPMFVMFAIFAGFGALATALADIIPTIDILGGKVASAEGMIIKTTRQTHGRGAHTIYYYTLDRQRWVVTPEAFRALLEGSKYTYRVFYLPRSKQLVGIEPTKFE